MVESCMTDVPAKRQEERKTADGNRKLELEGAVSSKGYLPTDVFGNIKSVSKQSWQQSTSEKTKHKSRSRKAPPCYMTITLVKAPPDCGAEVTVKMPPPLPSMSIHALRVDNIRGWR